MPLQSSLIGHVVGSNVPGVAISIGDTAPIVSEGSNIVVAVISNNLGDLPTDSKGNTYELIAASSHDTAPLSCALYTAEKISTLQRGDEIIVRATSDRYNVAATAVEIPSLNEGVRIAASSGCGTDSSPIVALPNTSHGNYAIAIVGTDGPSSDTFTQDPYFQSISEFGGILTKDMTIYIGRMDVVVDGPILYNPKLSESRNWVALIVELTP